MRLSLGWILAPTAGLGFVMTATIAVSEVYRADGSIDEHYTKVSWCSLFERKANIEETAKRWAQVDEAVQTCLAARGIGPTQLTQNCIGPESGYISQRLSACRQAANNDRRAREAEAQRLKLENDARSKERLAAAAATRAALENDARRTALENDTKDKQRLAAEALDRRRHELAAKYGERSADAILAGKVIKDMGSAEVIEVRGAPQRKDFIPPNRELWIYVDARITFTNGKVTYVGQ
jgi:hypothetical protein